MAPMTRNRAGEGRVPTELNALYYAQRASAGLIITEASQISRQGIGYPNTPGIHTPEQIAGWTKVTDAVHALGGVIFLQLWHCGRISHSSWQDDGGPPVAPSAICADGMAYSARGPVRFETPRALRSDELPGILMQYVDGAKNAMSAGFDGVELHAANGYLLDQFLRSGTNQRTDEFGGSVERRVRFPLEVCAAVGAAIGSDRVGIRISPAGSFNDMSDDDPLATFGYFAQQLNAVSPAYLHVAETAAGQTARGMDPIPTSFFRSYFRGALMANGGYDRLRAVSGLEDGSFDLVSFGKPFIANPDLPARLEQTRPLAAPDTGSFYGGNERGYVDYTPFSD